MVISEVLGAYLKTDDKKNSPVAVKRIYLAVKNAEILDKVTDFVVSILLNAKFFLNFLYQTLNLFFIRI